MSLLMEAVFLMLLALGGIIKNCEVMGVYSQEGYEGSIIIPIVISRYIHTSWQIEVCSVFRCSRLPRE